MVEQGTGGVPCRALPYCPVPTRRTAGSLTEMSVPLFHRYALLMPSREAAFFQLFP